MNRIVEKVNFPIPKQPKAKRIAGLLKCENVQRALNQRGRA